MSYLDFDYSLDFDSLDFRKNPEQYRMGRGEQGVLSVEPYKSEILAHWRFKNPKIAEQSSQKIYEIFLGYIKDKDFVGADMARKFLQMGWTRARRYANHKSGRKYSTIDKENIGEVALGSRYKTMNNNLHAVKRKTKKVLPVDPDPEKAKAAEIFYQKYQQAKDDPIYKQMITDHKGMYPSK